MKFQLVLCLVALLLTAFWLFNRKEQTQQEFDQFLQQYKKEYDTSDVFSYRLAIYQENLAKIQEHNATPGVTYEQAINQFADLTQEEFIESVLGFKELPLDGENLEYHEHSDLAAEDIDWSLRDEIFRKVKNQGQCGSCWAFSTVANLEALNYISGSKKEEYFSEKMLLDCSISLGCKGGMQPLAFFFVKNHGILHESEYPYFPQKEFCKTRKGGFKIKGFKLIPYGNCSSLMDAISIEPISVSVDASMWQFYSKGIFSDCKKKINHAVTLVGLSQHNGYWKIKNSWGPTWGEQGFIRLSLGNTCGICKWSSYAYL